MPREATVRITEQIQERFRATIVYGDPIQSDDVILVPAARVFGGGGGGSDGEAGEGGGFGLMASPVGAWAISDKTIRWKPAIDLTTIITGGYMVAIAYICARWSVERRRAKGR
jgi:uncharacterized spore protein YtfJ